jgi:hypothetical protein
MALFKFIKDFFNYLAYDASREETLLIVAVIVMIRYNCYTYAMRMTDILKYITNIL